LLLDWATKPAAGRGVRIVGADGEWVEHPYSELARDVRSFAAALAGTGAPPGTGVALLIADPRQFLTSFMGTLYAGMVPSPLATARAFRGSDRYTRHLAGVFAVAAAGLVVADEALTPLARAAAAAAGIEPAFLLPDAAGTPAGGPTVRGADELAILQFTSGSSGRPKGVRVTWRNLEANVAAIKAWLGWRDDDVFATWLPLHHDMGLIGAMITPVISGTDLWIMTPEQFLREPARWLECFGRHGATMTTAPSFGYAYTARRVPPAQLEGLDFSRWRVAILGAERIDPAAVARFCALVGPRGFDHRALIGAYGLAESTLAVTGCRAGTGSRLLHVARASTVSGGPVEVVGRGTLGADRVGGAGWLVGCGEPLDGLGVSVVDESGDPVPDGVFGEIQISGSSVAAGYLSADGQTTDFGPDGLATGDAGFFFEGDLYVLGRLADSIKVRGVTVYAEDLEAELAQVDGLSAGALAVLLGTVDGVDHAILLAEREPEGSDWVEAAVARARAALSADVRFTVLCGPRGAVERTSSGKPRRRVLWARLLAEGARGWQPAYGSPPGPGAAPAAGEQPLVTAGGH
jgi:acyl-CoA synthetase (AMP-forming)/AMP-acid ligase II